MSVKSTIYRNYRVKYQIPYSLILCIQNPIFIPSQCLDNGLVTTTNTYDAPSNQTLQKMLLRNEEMRCQNIDMWKWKAAAHALEVQETMSIQLLHSESVYTGFDVQRIVSPSKWGVCSSAVEASPS